MTRFDEIQIGDSAEIIHTITDKDIENFVALTGDDNKIHVNKDYAGRTSFKRPVVHGMLSASFISTIIGTKIPGDGALWFSQSLEFLLPVRVGDTISIKASVIAKHDRLNAIELQTDIFNQDKQKVIAGRSKVKIIEQEIPKEDVLEIHHNQPKVALVIGASGGIGSATSLKLAKQGYSVAVHFNNNIEQAQKLVDIIVKDGQCAFAIKGDIMNERSVQELVEKVERRLGGISLLVNCAAVKIPNIKVESMLWEDIQHHLDINLKSNLLLVKSIIPGMKAAKAGKIILITSQVTDGTPPAEWLPYTTAKYALIGFAKSLAVELASHQINVNLVSPGTTDTDLIADIPEKSKMLLAAKTPLKRLATARDIANVIGFLASSEANYITGETIRVNGGAVMI